MNNSIEYQLLSWILDKTTILAMQVVHHLKKLLHKALQDTAAVA